MKSAHTAASAVPSVLPATAFGPGHYNALLGAVAKDRDRQAFAELFGHFAPRIKSFLMKGGAAPERAEELAQDTMVTVWQKAASFDASRANAATWIFTIARNKKIDAFRRKIRPEAGENAAELIADDTPLAPEQLHRAQEADIMERAMAALPKAQSDLLYKSYFEDKTHSDIAAETGLALGTVKSRIRLALDKLRGDAKIKELWL